MNTASNLNYILYFRFKKPTKVPLAFLNPKYKMLLKLLSIIDFAKVYQNLGFGEAVTQITGIEPYSHMKNKENNEKASQNEKSFSNSKNNNQNLKPKFDSNYRLKVEEVEPFKKDEIKLPEKDETDKNYSEIKKYLVDERCLDIDIVNDLIANGGKNGTGGVVLHLILY